MAVKQRRGREKKERERRETWSVFDFIFSQKISMET